jgi:plastocyanin
MRRSLIAALAVAAALVAVPAAGSSAGAGGSGVNPTTSIQRTVESDQKRALSKALGKCRKISVTSKRKACVRKAKRRFSGGTSVPVLPPGPVELVDVRDKYFSPTLIEIPKGGAVHWIWGNQNADAHNVTLLAGPKGVSPYDFETPLSPSVNYTFKRSFKVAGTYRFACSLHHLMEMTVEVKD